MGLGVLRTALRLRATSSSSCDLQLALQRWQLCSASKPFSAKAGDDDGGEAASGTDRGSWRSWVEQQLSGIDQAALSEQQQTAARQLQQQQQAQQPPEDFAQNLQQSAQADAQEEVASLSEDNQTSATPQLGDSPGPSGTIEGLDMPGSTPNADILEQPVSQLSAAEPAEPESQIQEPVPVVGTPAPPQLGRTSELSIDERVDVFLEAIRNRSWEQTNKQAVKQGDGQGQGLKLPPSGYSELGSVSQGRFQGQMLNPGRSFFPGQSYDPEDLLADTSTGVTRHQPVKGPLVKEHAFTNKQVLGAADFKNLQFLNAFVSNGGQILPRSKTKLQAKVHRHLARQIKTARIMALLPHSDRAREFKQGLEDFSDDDFDPEGEVIDSLPGYRKFMSRDQ